jgi:colanic acid/amylovoran biosynthesis glycosyltransferase
VSVRKLNLAIISYNKKKYSETFIHNHINHLPANVHLLYGGYLPEFYGDGLPISRRQSTFKRLYTRLYSKEKNVLVNGLKRYLLEYEIDVILAEYGPSGVELYPICRELNIPIIVHFHGYDAYRQDILNKYGKSYLEMFRNVKAIISVSRHMQNQLIREWELLQREQN